MFQPGELVKRKAERLYNPSWQTDPIAEGRAEGVFRIFEVDGTGKYLRLGKDATWFDAEHFEYAYPTRPPGVSSSTKPSSPEYPQGVLVTVLTRGGSEYKTRVENPSDINLTHPRLVVILTGDNGIVIPIAEVLSLVWEKLHEVHA